MSKVPHTDLVTNKTKTKILNSHFLFIFLYNFRCQCVNRQWIERDLIKLEEVSFVVFHFSLISENAKSDISCEMSACTTDVC